MSKSQSSIFEVSHSSTLIGTQNEDGFPSSMNAVDGNIASYLEYSTLHSDAVYANAENFRFGCILAAKC